jgi:hypothetical protein
VIVSLLVSSGACTDDLLAMTGGDVDWGGQQVLLMRRRCLLSPVRS